jgi:RNA polymerase sigma-70 factor (ECF subfamily)
MTAPQFSRAKAEIEELAVEAAAGSIDALGELYERCADLSYRFVAVRVQDQASAEDIASELWMRVARHIRGYNSTGSGFTAWLLTIASRLIADHFRKPHRRRETPTGDMLALDAVTHVDGPEEAAIRSDTAATVALALERLPARQRECLTLRFFVGLSVAETAATMGRTVGSVKVLQHRALKRLASALPPQTGANSETGNSVTSVVDGNQVVHGDGREVTRP